MGFAPPQGFGGGGSSTLSQVLANGNVSGANDVILNNATTKSLIFRNGAANPTFLYYDGTSGHLSVGQSNGDTNGTLNCNTIIANSGVTAAFLTVANTLANYNGVGIAGLGLPPIYGSGSFAAASALQASIATFTPASPGTFFIDVWMNIVTTGSASLNMEVTYHDENGTARTCIIPLTNNAGTTTAAAVSATGPYYGRVMIRTNATAITVLTAGTTATSYDGGATISQAQ